MDLKKIPRWHAFAYLCTLLGCFGDVLQNSVDDGDPHDVDMELEGNVPWIFMMMHLSLHICKQKKFYLG